MCIKKNCDAIAKNMAEIEIFLPSDSGDISPIDGGTVALIILSQNLVIHIKLNWFDRE